MALPLSPPPGMRVRTMFYKKINSFIDDWEVVKEKNEGGGISSRDLNTRGFPPLVLNFSETARLSLQATGPPH